MHMDMSQEPFDARIYKKNAAPQKWAAHFVRACAVENMDISQEPFYVEICRKMLEAKDTILNEIG